MLMRRSLIVSGLALILFVGCAGPQQAVELFDPEQIQDASFYTFWQAQMPLSEGDSVEHCYLVDDNLYVTTEGGYLYAVQADKGLLRWFLKLTEPDYTIYPPAHLLSPDGRGPVVVVTTSRIYVFDRYSGDALLSTPVPFPPAGGAVGDMSRLYLGSNDGNMYSLLWNHCYGDEPLERWRLAAGAPIATTPVLLPPDTVIFTSEAGHVVACGGFDKSSLWVSRTGDGIVADPFADQSGVYVASLDRSVYRIELRTGEALWRFRMPRPLRTGPVVALHTCYQYCPCSGITAIDVDTGKMKWRREDAVKFLAGIGGQAVILTSGNTIEVVDNETGETKRSLGASRTLIAAFNGQGDAIYAASPNGRLACVRPTGTPYLRHQEVAASRAYVNRPPVEKESPSAEAPAETGRTGIEDPYRSRRDR